MVPLSKSGVQQCTGSSNLPLSANPDPGSQWNAEGPPNGGPSRTRPGSVSA